MQGVLKLQRKSFFLWKPNKRMQGPRSKHIAMPLPMNQILRCLSLSQNCRFYSWWLFFVFFIYITELTKTAITSAWTSFMPGHNSAVNTSLLLNWPKSAHGFQTSFHVLQTPASFDLQTKPRPEPQLLIFLTICLLLVCTLSQLLGEQRLPRGDQQGSACSSLWSSFSQRINICTLSSSLCRWAW